MPAELVSNPAQRTPPDSIVMLAMNASTEILLGSLSFLLGLAVGLGGSVLGLPGLLVGPLTLAATGLGYLAIERFLAREQDQGAPALGRAPRELLPCVGIALGAVVLAQLGGAGIGWLQAEALGIQAAEQNSIVELVQGGDRAQLVLLAISAIVLAPLTEELLFRHMFFRRLLHGSGALLAFALSAVAFSVFHFNPSGFAIYVWLGVVFASAYLLSGRLWVAMLTHAAYNASAFVLLVMEQSP